MAIRIGMLLRDSDIETPFDFWIQAGVGAANIRVSRY
jgi:hypothetical protein